MPCVTYSHRVRVLVRGLFHRKPSSCDKSSQHSTPTCDTLHLNRHFKATRMLNKKHPAAFILPFVASLLRPLPASSRWITCRAPIHPLPPHRRHGLAQQCLLAAGTLSSTSAVRPDHGLEYRLTSASPLGNLFDPSPTGHGSRIPWSMGEFHQGRSGDLSTSSLFSLGDRHHVKHQSRFASTPARDSGWRVRTDYSHDCILV